jgi:hypothetical protein
VGRPTRWNSTGISTIVVACLACAPSWAAALADTAVKPKIVLVELFTSEGCSSCPPADALLREIDGTQTSAGQLIVGISEHITYWNSLGWADLFSSPIYTNRQNAYGAHFGLDSVYTPQMVVDGKYEFVGSDRGKLERALREEQDQAAPIELRILSTSVNGNELMVTFSAIGDSSLNGSDIVAVLADDMDQSNVQRGENSGHILKHVAVARSMVHVAQLQVSVKQTVMVPLPASLDGKRGRHLILFAQSTGNGRILGVDIQPL